MLGEYSGDVNSIGCAVLPPTPWRARYRHGRHRLGGCHKPGGDAAQGRRRDAARDAQAGPALQLRSRADERGYIAIDGGPTTSPLYGTPTNRGIIVVEARERRGEPRRCALRDARPGLSGRLEQSIPAQQSHSGAIVVGAGVRLREPMAVTTVRPFASRFLQLGRAHRRAGLGPRGDVVRIWRPAGRHRTRISGTPTPSAARRALADRNRSHRRAGGHGAKRAGVPVLTRRKCATACGRPGRRSRMRRAAGDAADRQPARPACARRVRLRQGQGDRQGRDQGGQGVLRQGRQGHHQGKGGARSQQGEGVAKERKEGKDIKDVKESKEGKEVKERIQGGQGAQGVQGRQGKDKDLVEGKLHEVSLGIGD